MKNIIKILCVVFYTNTISAQNINFTDTIFKNILVNSSPQTQNARNLQGQFTKIDTNNDSEIQVSEALNILSLNLPNSNISNLTGLEYFTNIQNINVYNNLITQFHFPNLNLINYIDIGKNQLTTLNVSYFPNLTTLFIGSNPITSIDLSSTPLLVALFSTNTLISTLDLRNCPNLVNFYPKNSNISTIYLHPNAQLNYALNLNGGDCWANNPLNYVCIGASQVTALTNFLTTCGHNMSGITIDSSATCSLSTEGFNATTIKIQPNPSSTGIFTINLAKEEEVSLLVHNILGQVVHQENSKAQSLTLDLKNKEKGVYLLQIINKNGEKYSEKLVIE